MIRVELRRGDGLSSGRPWLNSVVKTVQHGLVQAGYPITADGKFGGGTQREVKRFQANGGLPQTGVVDRATWRALGPHHSAAVGRGQTEMATVLTGFRGDLDWIHQQEGHLGRPYWPKGQSGVTLDPGVDLGHAAPEVVDSLYGPMLTQAQMRALRQVYGLKREHARDALNRIVGIKDIRISRAQALKVMPHSAQPYWEGIIRTFRALTRRDTRPRCRRCCFRSPTTGASTTRVSIL